MYLHQVNNSHKNTGLFSQYTDLQKQETFLLALQKQDNFLFALHQTIEKIQQYCYYGRYEHGHLRT